MDTGSAARTRIKICCISSQAEADLARSHGADVLGLVSDMPSGPGIIDDGLIQSIAENVAPRAETFLLTSRTSAEDIAAHVKACRPTSVQIVQHLDPREYETLRTLLPDTPLVQVIHVEDAGAIELALSYDELADFLLLDSGRPNASQVELGGTGRTHDWSVSAEIVRASRSPVFLAGGLKPENVREAVTRVRPYGVDLCSGVRRDNALQGDLLEAFVSEVRAADAASAPHA